MESQQIYGQSLSQLSCKNYLYIKAPGNSTFIPIDEYYNKIAQKNPNFKFTHKKLREYKFKYRDKILNYDSLCIIDCNQMGIPSFYDSIAVGVEKLGTVMQEKGFCLRLLNTFDRYLGKARYETIKAATILDVDYLNSDTNLKPYSWQYFQRCYNAENAIYTYYSLYEIIILFIYICNNQGGGKTFEEYSKGCHSGNFRKKLKEIDNELFLWVSDGASEAKIHPDYAKVCDWCNMFKHRGILRFNGEYMSNQVQSRFIPATNWGLKPYNSEDNEFQFIDLDKEVIPELFNYHKKIIELASKVVEHFRVKESELI